MIDWKAYVTLQQLINLSTELHKIHVTNILPTQRMLVPYYWKLFISVKKQTKKPPTIYIAYIAFLINPPVRFEVLEITNSSHAQQLSYMFWPVRNLKPRHPWGILWKGHKVHWSGPLEGTLPSGNVVLVGLPTESHVPAAPSLVCWPHCLDTGCPQSHPHSLKPTTKKNVFFFND